MSSSRESIDMFVSVTGASEELAQQHLKKAGGDVQQAILLFLEGGDVQQATSTSVPAATASPSAPAGSIDSILGLAKDNGNSEEAGKGKGAGKGKDENLRTQKVGIIFFADGFMVDHELPIEEESPEPEAVVEAPKPVTRGIRMMSLDDLQKDSRGGRPKLPKKIPTLGPLRAFDTAENKQFLDDIKGGRVPKELQKRDEDGRPMYTSIAVSDERPRTYAELSKALDQMRKMKEEEEAEQKQSAPSGPALFTGAGQTLSSSAAASSPAAASSGSGSCDPALLKLVRAAAAPEVDESKPATTLQLRLKTGARVKARLNLEHTVADLWRLVSREMGAEAFATSSGHELAAGFPPKILADTSATLAAADLANAAVTHRCR